MRFLGFIFFLSLSGFAETLNVPNVNDQDATLSDIQNKAFSLIDRVTTGAQAGDSQALGSAFEDTLTYIMAEKKTIVSNLPALAASVGPKVKQAANTLSREKWDNLVNDFTKWSKNSGNSALIATATPMMWAANAGASPPPDTSGASEPREPARETKAREPTAPPTPAKTEITTAAVTSAALPKATKIYESSDPADSSLLGSVGAMAQKVLTEQENPIVEVEAEEEALAGKKAGRFGLSGEPMMVLASLSSPTEYTDLSLDKCYRMPERKRVRCAPGLAQLCFNKQGRRLPCP